MTADADRRVRGRWAGPNGGRHRHGSGAETPAPPRPLVRAGGRLRPADELPFTPSAFIFDVEGTLVDTTLPTLQCWIETLAELGFKVTVADLHPFLGMDGKELLRRLIKKNEPKLLEHIVRLQSERYRKRYLPHIRAFHGVRHLFAAIKDMDAKIALATSCEREELAHYLSVLNVDDLIDRVCSGDDAKREKPCPDVVSLAVKKLHLPPAKTLMFGDTPSDAEAAREAGVKAIGMQSGHFSRSDLIDAGCSAVFFDLQALDQKLAEWRAASEAAQPTEGADPKLHIAAMADSR